MIKILDKMFVKSSSTVRQSIIRAFMFSCIIGGIVWKHCLMMMEHFSSVEVMGAKLNKKVQIDMILESLLN